MLDRLGLILSMGIFLLACGSRGFDWEKEGDIHKIVDLSKEIERKVSPLIEKEEKIGIDIKGIEGSPIILEPVVEILEEEFSQSKLFKIVEASEIWAEAILEVEAIELKDRLVIKATLVDALDGDVFTSDATYIERQGCKPDKALMKKIEVNLELLEVALYNYMAANSKYEMVWPKSLEDLVPDYVNKIPDPIVGEWIYDSASGRVYNLGYPEIESKKVRLNMNPLLKRQKKAAILGKLGAIRSAVTIYYADNEKWPDRLEDLSPLYINGVPSPIEGSWEYNRKDGSVWHSNYPDE